MTMKKKKKKGLVYLFDGAPNPYALFKTKISSFA